MKGGSVAANSGIEWTDASWNCLAGCEAVSPGCANCYAATMTRRLEAMGQADYMGLTTAKHFNGMVRCLPDKLSIPLKWKKPRRVFVNSMSDLFHEDVPSEFIAKVFAVMALCPQHTFQVLTKRAKRMQQRVAAGKFRGMVQEAATEFLAQTGLQELNEWPLPNVWLGISAEDQQRADERIPWLLKTPAAVRFVSAEPLLGPIDFGSHLSVTDEYAETWPDRRIHWLIVGGESGHGARPCNIEWVRDIVAQCSLFCIPTFVKQLGAYPFRRDTSLPNEGRLKLRDKKGGNPAEWPADLRVREFPECHSSSDSSLVC
jgi:protein gp37